MKKLTRERFSRWVTMTILLCVSRNFYISFWIFVGYRAWTNTSNAYYVANMLPYSSIILAIGYIICRASYAQEFYSKEGYIVPNKKFYISFWKLILFIDSLLLGLAAIPWIRDELGRETTRAFLWYAILLIYTMVCLFQYLHSIKKAYKNNAKEPLDEVKQ